MTPAPATGEQHELEQGSQRAVVTEVGATLRSWQLDGDELLDSFGLDSPGAAYRGKVLMPWPNRLRNGRYSFGGSEHVTPLTEPERDNAMHGLVSWVNWRVIERTTSRTALAYRLHPQPGYPFVLDVGVEYALVDAGLEVTLHAANRGSTAAPFGAALHPYLAVGEGRVDDARLQVPARAWLPVDEQLVPTGETRPVEGTRHDFRSLRAIGDAQVDTTYTDLEPDADGRSRVEIAFESDGRRRHLTVWMDDSFSHLQVYTGDEDPDPQRRRRSVAVEPMTCAPNAFNSGRGLLVLEPGEEFGGCFGIVVSEG